MKKYILLLIFVFGTFQVFSQKKPKKDAKKKDSISEVVNVVTSYTPTIADAFKIKKSPKIVLSKNTKKRKLTYAIFSAPVASTFIPKSGVLKGIDVGKRERLFDNYVAVGYGNFNTPFIEAFLHQNRKFETDYGIYLKYISSEDGIENTPLDNGYSNLNLGAYYMKEERYFTWKIGGNVQQQKYNWYGLPDITFDEESITSILEKQTYGFYELEGEIVFVDSYFKDIKASLSMFDDNFGSKEIGFSLKPNFKLPLDRINRNFNDLELNTSIDYLQGEFEQNYINDSNVEYSFLNIGLNPIYRLEWNKFNIKLGAKVYLTSDIENSLTDFLAYPDVQITYPLISSLANIYVGAGGDLHMNSFQSLSKENPFVSPTLFLTQTNEQYNLFGGINGKFSSSVSFDFKASYKSDEDRALFVRNNSKSNGVFDISNTFLGYEYGNSFNVFYDDISTFSLFAEVEIDVTKRFIMGGNVQANSYTTTNQQEAWNLPKIEGAVFGKYKNNKWYATANVFFVGERQDLLYGGTFPSTTSGIQTLDAFVDVNLNGGYHFNDFVSAFIKLNNVLGTDYERYANFNVQGFQVLAGATYKFDF
tara:strand:+ start:6200 stop:7966 length:1767 start_codon:yes stop_codon:yes gene_type:complete